MKKIFLILAILITPLFIISQNDEKLDLDKVESDIKEWGSTIDTIVESAKNIIVITKDDIKRVGLITHLKNWKRIYLPLVILIIMYIVWLNGRSKGRKK